MRTALLLLCSNLFMTAAWYGHLRYRAAPLLVVVLVSWLIALPEYAFQVPANRLGHASGQFTAPQLKILQEVISISIFVLFSAWWLGETPRWNEWAALALIVAAVIVMLYPQLRTGGPTHQ
jgi:uncharacterized protein (DUF486 family)